MYIPQCPVVVEEDNCLKGGLLHVSYERGIQIKQKAEEMRTKELEERDAQRLRFISKGKISLDRATRIYYRHLCPERNSEGKQRRLEVEKAIKERAARRNRKAVKVTAGTIPLSSFNGLLHVRAWNSN